MAEAADEIEELREAVNQLRARVSALESRAVVVPPTSKDAPQLESRFGLTVVNRVGALTLAIGIIFVFKYAADNQWIGPVGKVLAGLLFGIGLLVAAGWLHGRDQRVFAQGLAGCGLAAVYTSLYASFAYYKLSPQLLGFFLVVGACAFAVFLSARFCNSAIAYLGFTGAFLTIVLLRSSYSGLWFDAPYLLLLDAAAIGTALKQQWPLLIPVDAVWAILCAASLIKGATGFIVLSLILAAIHFGVSTIRQPHIRSHAYIVGHACVLLAMLRAVGQWATGSTLAGTVSSIALTLYGIAALIAGISLRSVLNRGLGLALLGIVIAKLYLWDVWQLNYEVRMTAFVVLGVLLLVASYIYSRWKSRPESDV